MNTHVDTTKLNKKSPIYQKVDIQEEIKHIKPGKYTGKESWTPGAEILVWTANDKKQSPVGIVMTLMKQQSDKFYKRAEKTEAKFLGNLPPVQTIDGRFRKTHPTTKAYRAARATCFFYCLDMMLIEVQNTIMHIALSN